ncbi:allophanate hydrolase subunit 1 [Sinomonas atrocyanea]|jgi:urea carboxylase|uniref:5-oxoprolinase subunit B family protein n=1 Tax=Sinomonas atrocyanea TaxID=37927 RepID=UPI0027878443|nr:carboxyltransferase domain-containing protein [Sinomonas atrocyanea]MDQ0261164.1 urea carboxylase [Sinomonas atrocyanea]MDR6620492.1 urea carboxylase [Sinomonas atrocyanea]
MSTQALEREARYTWGGDEFLFVEVDEAMSLAANFKVMTLASKLSGAALEGVTDICPANASLLIRFNPDVLAPSVLEAAVRGFEQEAARGGAETLETRIVEVPVWYDDPFTAEVAQRFREGFHQEPEGTDLDYAAKVNGLADAAEFIRRHHEQPWLVSMVGFVAGLPFLFQLVERQKQLEVPKYLSPRTDTPKLTVGHGGCFGAIYSVRGAGGYQMFGVAAAPIYDPAQTLADFKDFMVFFRPGDIVKFKPVTEQEYAAIQAEVENGTFRYRQAPVVFELHRALEDPERYNRELMEALDGV